MTTVPTVRSTTRSEAIRAAARSVVAAHTAPNTTEVASTPVLTKAAGCVVTDADGNEYVDLTGADGTAILGHADERITVAINKAVAKGLHLPSPTDGQVRLAEIIASRFPAVDVVAFTGSLADARNGALACAMAHTGRTRILGNFGGMAMHPNRLPISANDTRALHQAFDKYGPSIAAVVMEPVATDAGLVVADARHMAAARIRCDEHGALMILDEHATAFHLAVSADPPWGHAAPDLTVFGTIIGGGLSLAAFGGRRDIMSSHRPPHPSPISGLPLSVAAGLATLEALAESERLVALDALARRLEEGLLAAASSATAATQHAHFANMVGIYFTATPCTDPGFLSSLDSARFARFHGAMLDHGILLPAHPAACCHVMMAHTTEHIDRTVEAAHDCLCSLR